MRTKICKLTSMENSVIKMAKTFNQVNVPMLEILNTVFFSSSFIRDKSSSMKMLIHKTNALLGMFPPCVRSMHLSLISSVYLLPCCTHNLFKSNIAFLAFSSAHCMSLSGAMFYAVWIVNKWKRSLRHCCSVLFLALHHHEFSQKTDSKSRNRERRKKGGKRGQRECNWTAIKN